MPPNATHDTVAVVVLVPSYDPAVERLIATFEAGETVVVPYGDAGFGAAANAGAARTSGDTIVFLNAAEPVTANWPATLRTALQTPAGGVVGPRILTNDGASEECGIVLSSAPLTAGGFELMRYTGVPRRLPVDAVSSDCLATSRTTFDALGGFAGEFGSDWESIDYCLRVLESGRTVVVEPNVSFKRHVAHEPDMDRAFAKRWRDRAVPRENFWPELTKSIVRRTFHSVGILVERVPIPAVTVLVYGDAPAPPDFMSRLFGSRIKPVDVVWAANGDAPPETRKRTDVYAAARTLTELRGPDYVAFVRTDTALAPDWLNELVNTLESAADTVAAAIVEPWSSVEMPASADGRCTLVAPRLVPQHVRIEESSSFDRSVTTWLGLAVGMGRNIARVRRTATVVVPADAAPPAVALPVLPVPADVSVTIVMLSWNAPQFTEAAVASIREHTALPFRILLIDNGSGAETVARLRALEGVDVIYNAVNTGFAFACNQGLAMATGTHVVLLNNDVIVTAGWLEPLIDVQRRNPTVGCSAPRTNRIAGRQQVDDVPYTDVADLPAYAARRAIDERGRWTREFRVVGFCMCLDRRAVAEIGGLDPTFGTGNFEDDDYCLRLRAAGYDIAVCEDSFIHHFGSVSFTTNKVDYSSTFARNKAIFSKRWNAVYSGDSYEPRALFRRGYMRERDFVPLPEPVAVGSDWRAPA